MSKWVVANGKQIMSDRISVTLGVRGKCLNNTGFTVLWKKYKDEVIGSLHTSENKNKIINLLLLSC